MSEADDRQKRIEELYAGAPVSPPKRVPGGYPVALLERAIQGEEAAFDEIGEFLHRGATELMRRGRGGMPPTAYIFCRHDPMGRDEPDPLYTVAITAPDGAENGHIKNTLTLLTHATAMIGQARAVAFVMEAWAVKGPKPEGVKSLEFVPGREEIVNALIETETATRVWRGPITRYGRTGFVIGAFEKWPIDMIPCGRFFGTMHPGYDPNKAASAAGDTAG